MDGRLGDASLVNTHNIAQQQNVSIPVTIESCKAPFLCDQSVLLPALWQGRRKGTIVLQTCVVPNPMREGIYLLFSQKFKPTSMAIFWFLPGATKHTDRWSKRLASNEDQFDHLIVHHRSLLAQYGALRFFSPTPLLTTLSARPRRQLSWRLYCMVTLFEYNPILVRELEYWNSGA